MPEEKRGFCTLCKSRCGAIFTIEDGRLTSVRPDPEHPTGTAMCPKGRSAPEIAHSTRRLTTPLRRTNPKSDPDPGWVPVSWDEAMAEITEKIGTIAAETGPESVAFAVATPSGAMVSDATEWVERFVRRFGSPNTVYSTEICNWHKDVAHAFTFGSPIPPPDYANADLALLWGFNPAKTWLAQSAACAAWTPDKVAATTWIPGREIRALAAEIAAAPSVTYYGWTGVGQSANAAQTERALATLCARPPAGSARWPATAPGSVPGPSP